MPYKDGCRDCGGPIVDDRGEPCDGTRCDNCRKKRNRAAAEIREYRRENGLCQTCGASVSKTKLQDAGRKRVRKPAAYCAEHLAYYAARQASRSG